MAPISLPIGALIASTPRRLAGIARRQPALAQQAVDLVQARRPARDRGVEVDADRDRHALPGLGPAGIGARHVRRGAREVDAVAGPGLELVAALRESVLQADIAGHVGDDVVLHRLRRHHHAVAAVPDVHHLASPQHQPEIVLPVDVEGHHRRRRRDEDEAGHQEHAGLLAVDDRFTLPRMFSSRAL